MWETEWERLNQENNVFFFCLVTQLLRHHLIICWAVMLGISLGLFFPSHTTVQKLFYFLRTSLFPFLILFPFCTLLLYHNLPRSRRNPNTHDNLIVFWCGFNTELWWEVRQSWRYFSVCVCVGLFFFHCCNLSTIFYSLIVLISSSDHHHLFAFNIVYNGDVSFPFTDCKALTH